MSATVVPMPAREQRSGREPLSPGREPLSPGREPLWREVVGDALRAERLAQHRTLKDVATSARVSLAYLSEVERGRKEASSEVLAAATGALGIGLVDLVDAARTRLQPAPARTGEVTNLAA